jgi:hypothetical protein
MSENFKYLRIKNWERYQPNNSLRSKDAVLQWVKDYTDREDDAEYRSLTMYQRGVLDGLCRLAGRTRSRLLQNDVTHIAGALHILPRERAHLPHAITTLTSLGFLVPCNEQVENQIVQKGRRDREGEVESEVETDLLVSRSASEPTGAPADAGEVGETGEGTWEDLDVPAFDLPCWTPLHEEFGATTHLPEAAVRDVHTVLKQQGLDVAWMRGCVRFALANGFWKNRVVSAKTFAKHLVNGFGEDADTKLPAQYNRHLLLKQRGAGVGGKK